MAVRDIFPGDGIIIIIAGNGSELNNLLQTNGRLKDHSVIIDTDNSRDDLTHPSLKLYPRYTGYINTDYTDIELALEKMLKKSKTEYRERRGEWQRLLTQLIRP